MFVPFVLIEFNLKISQAQENQKLTMRPVKTEAKHKENMCEYVWSTKYTKVSQDTIKINVHLLDYV